MYWYISFLRPPPVSITSQTKEVVITPQIANDLRTELRYNPTTIHYTWQRLSPTLSPSTSPKELTIFIPPQSTYKPIAVPLPSNVQIGESWRLGLFSPPTEKGEGAGPSSSLLGLCEDEVDVIGVWSEGINIVRSEVTSTAGVVKGVNGKSSRHKEKEKENSRDGKNGKSKGKEKEKEKDDGPKQGRITRDFTLPRHQVLESQQGTEQEMLRIIEQTSFDLDKKIWDSGLALSSWFWKYLPSTSDLDGKSDELVRKVFDLLRQEDDLDILEIGSGTGLVSIALALAIQRYLPDSKRNIIATDLDTAIPLMNENLSFNSLLSSSSSNAQVNAKVLDWDQPLPSWVSSNPPELIVAADVTYNTSAFPSLLRTLTSLLAPSPAKKPPILILAYKQRDPSERDLWTMLQEKGVSLRLVDKVVGVERDQGETEIWIGRMI
ncbi:hypothetical protein I302_102020 [Kwoniella bestiolae CBS 10118]|uniref:Uncharacterized protein n=1 Tax=Kwoniella bestiolae CBS 10118 TaxID=1296100 RepID=A0AAJ8K3E5_9TREE